ncbi:MAG: tRNA (guanosine(46)-N7)-methyltransferase TrmB [Bacteroidales bacterium]
MGKNKLHHFSEIKSYPHVFEPEYEDLVRGFPMKSNWGKRFFKNDHPIVLEIGCGKGEYTVGLAQKYPTKNFIGIDIKGARIWRGAKTSFENKMKNVAFLRLKIEQLMFCFSEEEVDEIWITFPDPQPKAKEIRKRLTAPRFLETYRNILKTGGIIHLKTDNLNLFNYSVCILPGNKFSVLYKTANLYQSDFNGDAPQIQTYYERKYLKENIPIKYLMFTPNKKNNNSHQMDNDSFFQRVFEVVKIIPHGRVTSYGAIANYLGSKGAARMVGWAMNASHSSADAIPAHRVVNRNGLLTGKHHFGSPGLMQQLLESENIKVEDNKISEFDKLFWDPAKELI